MRAWRWVKREAYAWVPGLPWGLSARQHRIMRRLRYDRPAIKIERLGVPDAPRTGWDNWERVKQARARKVRDVLEQKEKKE